MNCYFIKPISSVLLHYFKAPVPEEEHMVSVFSRILGLV